MSVSEGQSVVFEVANGCQLELLWVGAGSFMMGSPESESGRDDLEGQFLAILTEGFWLSKYPITQVQWRSIMKNNPSHFHGEDRPVEMVNWIDAMQFCTQLNLASGKSLPGKYNFSLPTEVQWEYACRAGTATKYFFGEDDSEIGRFAWHAGDSLLETHPVGQKEANPWGFCDMHGNVCQWCYDALGGYPDGEATDRIVTERKRLPSDYDELADLRIVRGTGYDTTVGSSYYRSAHRSYWRSNSKRPWCGFRVAVRMAS
jgi:formylglycine-generating enzyme required for sulfatase activity